MPSVIQTRILIPAPRPRPQGRLLGSQQAEWTAELKTQRVYWWVEITFQWVLLTQSHQLETICTTGQFLLFCFAPLLMHTLV